MCNKVCGTLEMLKDIAVDICCMTETWFKAKENDIFAEIHDFGFDVISSPRKGKGFKLYNTTSFNIQIRMSKKVMYACSYGMDL